MNNKTETLHDIIESFFKFALKKGFHKVSQSSLISPYIENDFNLSAGHRYIIPVLMSQEKRGLEKIVVCEPCFRRADLGMVGYNPYYLLLFEMGVAGIFGYIPKPEKVKRLEEVLQFLTQWLSGIGIKMDNCTFTVSGGGKILNKTFNEDRESYRALINIGISPKQILVIKGRRNLIYSQGNNRPAGYSIEVFYKNPDFDVEIASLNIYTHLFRDGSLIEIPNTGVGCGVGCERISYILNSYQNIFQTDVFSGFLAGISSYFKPKELDLCKQRIYRIGELLKSLLFIIGDGQMSGKSGRGKIVNRLAQNLFSEIDYLGLPVEVVSKSIQTFAEVYFPRYSYKEKQNLIRDTLLKMSERAEKRITS